MEAGYRERLSVEAVFHRTVESCRRICKDRHLFGVIVLGSFHRCAFYKYLDLLVGDCLISNELFKNCRESMNWS